MRQVCIYDRNNWRLTSYGNGWAYLLEDLEGETPHSVWLQDDDANYFRESVMDDDGWLYDSCEERFADYADVMQPI